VSGALDLVGSMVIENGARWGEAATPEQWDDMEALLSGEGPRRHFWLRARGRSKTTDCAAASLAMMLTVFGAGDECYAAAAGRDQAGLIIRKVRGIAERTPELAGALDIQNYRIITPRTGAMLDVISSDLATSWGKTPRWLFVDEVANHGSGETAQQFADSLLTALIKRPDSQCLCATTPSSPSHWAYGLWQAALGDPLWRTSVVSGPAPWQDPAELASERARLPESLWKRLFECVWAEADDALADAAAVDACVRHEGAIPAQPGTVYVVSFDLSVSSDHTAVAVAHIDDGPGGQRTVVADRLEAWVPRAGRQVDLGEVESWIMQASRDYGGAMIVGDPYQAVAMCQRLRDCGHQVKAVQFTAQANSRRAQMLLRLVRDHALNLPADENLRRELLSLRLTERASPGTLKLTTDGSSAGHYDRVTAVMLGAEELLSRGTGSYLGIYGDMACCDGCGRYYPAARPACQWCGRKNDGYEEPAPKRSAILAAAGAAPKAEPVSVTPGGWASAYYPPNAVRCQAGHFYDGKASKDRCPQCITGTLSFLHSRGRPVSTGGIGRPGGFTGIRENACNVHRAGCARPVALPGAIRRDHAEDHHKLTR
jgi:Phage Terminase